jgi:hypothetical protein
MDGWRSGRGPRRIVAALGLWRKAEGPVTLTDSEPALRLLLRHDAGSLLLAKRGEARLRDGQPPLNVVRPA